MMKRKIAYRRWRNIPVLVLASGICLIVGCTPSGETEGKNMAMNSTNDDAELNDEEEIVISVSGSRIGPPLVASVVFEGKRYEQIFEGHLEGLDQRTGLLAVFDNESGSRLATVVVYAVERIEMLEDDVQDVFFISMELNADARQLEIENERGRLFKVSLDDLSVEEVNSGK